MVERYHEQFPNLPNRPTPNPIQKPIEKPIQKPIENPIQRPIEKPIQKPIEKPIQKPIQKPIEKPIQKPIDNPIQKPIERPATCPPYTMPYRNKPQADPALVRIMQYQFAVYDVALYLDTHPNDTRAIATRQRLARELHEMTIAYEKNHGPMNLFSPHGDYAKYVNEAWPWDICFEGGQK